MSTQQTASLAASVPQLAKPPTLSSGPVNLSLNPFKTLAGPPTNDALTAAETPPDDNSPGTLGSNITGPRFVPLLKADQPSETNNKATFIQQHEFGLLLRSDF